LTIRAADGTAIDSNRVPSIELLSSTDVALAPALWTKLTNHLLLSNGVVYVTNLSRSNPNGFFLLSEPK
jgi:hypothetical protein